MSVVYLIIGAILKLFLWIEGHALNAVADLFDILVMVPSNVATHDAVQLGWVTVRDILNMFFILILLVIAFATILRVENYQYKKILPRLIIAILLVNFSRAICAFFIEISDLLMKTFTFGNQGKPSAALLSSLKLTDLTNISETVSASSITDISIAGSLFFLVVFVGVFVLALLVISILLLVRFAALMFLTIVSPFAFLLDVLPSTQQYAKRWWSEFFKFVLYGPAATFCVYLTMRVANSMSAKGVEALFGAGASTNQLSKADLQRAFKESFLPTNFSKEHFLTYMLIVTMLLATYMIAKGVGSFGAGALIGMATSGLRRGVGMYGNLWKGAAGLGWKGASALNRRSLMKGNEGAYGWAWKNTAGRVTSRIGAAFGAGEGQSYEEKQKDLEGRSGSWVQFASPTVLKDAWMNRAGRIERQAAAGSRGYVENKLNKILPWSKDETDYETQEVMKAADEELEDLKVRHPDLQSDDLIGELAVVGAEKGGRNQQIRMLAITKALGMGINWNDTVHAAGGDSKVRDAVWGADAENQDWFKSRYEAIKDSTGNEVLDKNGRKTYNTSDDYIGYMRGMEHMFGQKLGIVQGRNVGNLQGSKGNAAYLGVTENVNGKTMWRGQADAEQLVKEKKLKVEDVDDYLIMRQGEAGLAMRKLGQTARSMAGQNQQTVMIVDSDGNVVGLRQNEAQRIAHGDVDVNTIGTEAQFMNEARKKLEATEEMQKIRLAMGAGSMLANVKGDNTGRNGAALSFSLVANGRGLKEEQLRDLIPDVRANLADVVSVGTEAHEAFRKEMIKVDVKYKDTTEWNTLVSDMKKNQVKALGQLEELFGDSRKELHKTSHLVTVKR